MRAGMDCARLNCSHGTHDDLRRRAASVRATAERTGKPIGLLFDLQGPKLRLAGDVEPRQIARGDAVAFSGGRREDCVAVEFEKFAALVTQRSQIVIGDGVPRFAVDRIEDGVVHARAVSPGPGSRR